MLSKREGARADSWLVTTNLLSCIHHDISSLLPGKLVTTAMSAVKSSNPDTRAKAIKFMLIIQAKCEDLKVAAKIVTELLVLPKTGKTTSPEHRIALIQMVGRFAHCEEISPVILDTLPALCSKEGNEGALAAICTALVPHLAWAFANDSKSSLVSAAPLVKELGSTKVSTRRALANAVGQAIWEEYNLQHTYSSDVVAYLKQVLSAFQTGLASASTNQPANSSGFLEGYVAVALALGPLYESPIASDLVQSSAIKDALAITPKPSFILNDKVYTRLPTYDDEKWLLRCLEGIIKRHGKKLNDTASRQSIGLALFYLAFESKFSETRGWTISAIAQLVHSNPALMSHIIRDSLTIWLQTQDARPKPKQVDEEDTIKSKSRDIGRLLSLAFEHRHDDASGARGNEAKAILEDIAVDFIVLAHHPEINEDAQVSWIGLVQSMGLDPATVAVDKRVSILERLWEAASAPPKDTRLAEAAYRAITTLAFVQPEIYVPAVLEKLKADLDPASLDFIGLEERGIWATPSDQLFVDGTSLVVLVSERELMHG